MTGSPTPAPPPAPPPPAAPPGRSRAGTRPTGLLHSLSRGQRVLIALLAVVAASVLAGVMALTVTMLDQTRELSAKVELTEGIVDANVRTLSQVQREVLRLQVRLADPTTTRSDLRLQTALVTQRTQEGTLSYQLKTLGAQDLLDRAGALEQTWRSELLPLVREASGTGPGAARAQARLEPRLVEMEQAYNQLVSDGENNRKLQAGAANEETKTLLSGAHNLVEGLLAALAAVGALILLVGFTFASFHRQRARANADLLELNDQLHKHAHVVAATDNMVVISDADGLVDWVNPAFERSTGYSLAEMVGRRPGAVLQGPDVDPDVVARMSAAVAAGESFSAEVLNHAKDGTAYWVAMEVNPIYDSHGRHTGFVAVQTDVTERRRRDALLREAKEAAEETAREKSTFLASMSHEIRTPLNAVLGLTDLLLMTDLDEGQREYATTARSSGRLLLALINDILDFSALEAGRIDPEQHPFDLAALVAETVDMLSPEGRRKGVAVVARLDDDLPARVCGDDTRLRQVLVNLVGNAVKFTEHGEVCVEVSRAPGEDQISFVVRDSGIGMPPEQLGKLFQPFIQGDASTTRRYGGTGLGLAICRLLAARMGGSICVESEPGHGSAFTVTVPLPVTDEPLEDDGPVGEPAADGVDLAGLRVLLAEDDLVNQTVARHMLSLLEVQTVVVGDGAAAVEAVRAGGVDVVLMDVHMPVVDGVQATSTIRAEAAPAHGPYILALTANALEGDRERLLAGGMDGYLSKPVDLEALRGALARAVQSIGATRPAATPQPSPAPDDAAAAAAGPPSRPPASPDAFAVRTGVEDTVFYATLVADVLRTAQAVVEAGPHQDDLVGAAHRLCGAAASASLAPLAEAAGDLEHRAARDEDRAGDDPAHEPTPERAWAAVVAETGRVARWLEEQAEAGVTVP